MPLSFNTNFNTTPFQFDWNSANMGTIGGIGSGTGLDFSSFWNSVGGSSITSGDGKGADGSSNTGVDTLEGRLKWQKEHKTELEASEKALKEQEEQLKVLQDAAKNAGEDKIIKQKESKEEFKKMPWWKKLGRGILRAGEGILKTGMDMLGIEASLIPPKFHVDWKKLGKAALCIAGAAVATCIPGIGPLVTPALLTMGLASGTVMAGKGIYKAATTDDPEEFDRACQDIGGGGAIAFCSAVGIRKWVNPGFTGSAFNPKNYIQGIKEIPAALRQGLTQSRAQMASMESGQASFTNLFKGNFRELVGANRKKAEYEKQLKDLTSDEIINSQVQNGSRISSQYRGSMREELSNINKELNQLNLRYGGTNNPMTTEDAALKAILEEQQARLTRLIGDGTTTNPGELSSKSADAWKSLRHEKDASGFGWFSKKKLEVEYNCGRDITINGVKFNKNTLPREQFNRLVQMRTRANADAKAIQNLAKLRKSYIQRSALMRQNTTDVTQYIGRNENYFGSIYNTFKPSFQYRGLTKTVGSTAKFAILDVPMISFKPWMALSGSPLTTGYKVEKLYDSLAGKSEVDNMIGGFLGWGSHAIPTADYQKDANGNVVTDQNGQPVQVQRDMTVDDVKALEEELRQSRKKFAECKRKCILPGSSDDAKQGTSAASDGNTVAVA